MYNIGKIDIDETRKAIDNLLEELNNEGINRLMEEGKELGNHDKQLKKQIEEDEKIETAEKVVENLEKQNNKGISQSDE